MGIEQHSAAPARGRGRPQRLPVDATPADAPGVDARRRIAWLLTTWRLLGPDPEHRSRTAFIALLKSDGHVLDSPRLSRWESGESPAPDWLVAAYEQQCRLAPGSLTAVSGLLKRAGVAPRVEDADRSPPEWERLDVAMAAVESGTISGPGWLDLAAQLARTDRAYLSRSTWQQMCRLLVNQFSRSTGVALVQRYEAVARLARHPQAHRHLVRSIGEFVMPPDAQNVARVLWLLQEVSNDQAGELTLRLLADERAPLRRGAEQVMGALLARGAFSDDGVAVLQRHARRVLSATTNPTTVLETVDLASRLPELAFQALLPRVEEPSLVRVLHQARSSHLLRSRREGRATTEAVASFAEAVVHDPSDPPVPATFDGPTDQMLRRLVGEVLFHAHQDRRYLAAMTLASSVYAGPVARGLLRVAEDHDEYAAGTAWLALRTLGHVSDRETITRLALAERRSALQERALVATAWSSGQLSETSADELARLAADGDHPLSHAALFSLGMAGNQRVEALAGCGSSVAPAARWWRASGHVLHEN